jgi:4,5-epoxidase
MMRTAVIVVGAGPTGLALACDLRTRGVDVRVMDRLAAPAQAFRALGLQPRGRQILERLGALGDLSSNLLTSNSYGVFIDQRRVAQLSLEALEGPNDNGVLRLPQTEIERCLRQRLLELGTDVQWGAEIVGVTEEHDGLTVRVRQMHGEEVIRADWLVGCDGAHSTIRHVIGTSLEGSTFPEPFMVADLRLTGEPKQGTGLYLREDYAIAAVRLPDGQWRIGGSLPKDSPLASVARQNFTADTSRRGNATAQQLEMLRALYANLSGDDRTRFLDCSWFAVFSIHRRTASTFRRGRIFIAGDAAHLSSPIGGQGMNSGIGDAANLGWKLALVAHGRADPGLLDTYEAERRPAIEKVERATTQSTRIMLGEGALNQFLRRYLMIPALHFPSVLGWAMTRRPALRSNYRNGPLAMRHTLLSRRPQSGDEAPDVRCVRKDGKPTSIGREIGARWGLLFFGDQARAFEKCAMAVSGRLGSDVPALRIVSAAPSSPDADCGQSVVLDASRAVRKAYRAHDGTSILLRPDGYIACRVHAPEPQALLDWLDQKARISPPDNASGLRSHHP